MTKDQEFAELMGIKPDEYWFCPKCKVIVDDYDDIFHYKVHMSNNCRHKIIFRSPNFSDPVAVLRVINEFTWQSQFYSHIGCVPINMKFNDKAELLDCDWAIPDKYLLTPGLLRDEAIRWKEAKI